MYAEALAGMALTQLVRPGAPVVFGMFGMFGATSDLNRLTKGWGAEMLVGKIAGDRKSRNAGNAVALAAGFGKGEILLFQLTVDKVDGARNDRFDGT